MKTEQIKTSTLRKIRVLKKRSGLSKTSRSRFTYLFKSLFTDTQR